MNRRRYLGLLGGMATGLAGCAGMFDRWPPDGTERPPSPTATPAGTPGPPTRGSPAETPSRTVDYGTVVNMVEDAGCDPEGNAPCDEQLRRAADDDTLLVFPPGTYLFAEVHGLYELNRFGLLGRGRVRFKAPPNHNGKWLVVDRGRGLLFENIDLDVRAENSAPTLKLGATDGLTVRDVEVVGRGRRHESRPRGEGGNVPVGHAFLPLVRSPEGSGTVERFVATAGGRIGTYNRGDGRAGIYIGQSHRGTIRLVDCRLEEFPNNGIYASRTHGRVRVVGGTFRNNDISQVRIGSEGSYLRDADVEVDVAAVRGPNSPGDFLNPRGVRLETGDVPTSGAAVQGTRIVVKRSNANAPAIGISNAGGQFFIENTRIRVDQNGSSAIVAKPPTGGSHSQPPKPHGISISDVRITGSAASGRAIWLLQRSGNTMQRVTIDQPNGRRDGIHLRGSPGSTISDSNILAGRYPITLSLLPDATADACLVELHAVRGRSANVETDAAEGSSGTAGGSGSSPGCIRPRSVSVDGVRNPAIAIVTVDGDRFSTRVVPQNVLSHT